MGLAMDNLPIGVRSEGNRMTYNHFLWPKGAGKLPYSLITTLKDGKTITDKITEIRNSGYEYFT